MIWCLIQRMNIARDAGYTQNPRDTRVSNTVLYIIAWRGMFLHELPLVDIPEVGPEECGDVPVEPAGSGKRGGEWGGKDSDDAWKILADEDDGNEDEIDVVLLLVELASVVGETVAASWGDTVRVWVLTLLLATGDCC